MVFFVFRVVVDWIWFKAKRKIKNKNERGHSSFICKEREQLSGIHPLKQFNSNTGNED